MRTVITARYVLAVKRLRQLKPAALNNIWWPFTQHQGMTEEHVTTIEARAGESFVVARTDSDLKGSEEILALSARHDACSSWWTQVGTHHIEPHASIAAGGMW